MLRSLIPPLQLPRTHTTDCGGWPQELPSRCQGLQMSAVESYREWQGRRDRMLPSGGISRSHRGPDEVWHLGKRCSTRTHYINFAGQLLGAAVPPLAAIPNDSQSDCELKKAPSIEKPGSHRILHRR